MSFPLCTDLCTSGLCSRAVWVAQCQQGHLYKLVKQQISLDQHKLSMFFSPLSFQRAFLVLHYTEHRQQAPWGDGHKWCHTAWHQGASKEGIWFNQRKILLKTQSYIMFQVVSSLHLYPIYEVHVPLLCQLLLCGLTIVVFWLRQGFLATGLPCLLLSWAEGPAPFCSRRASLAGGGQESTTGSLPSGFLAPLQKASICGLTLMQRQTLKSQRLGEVHK